MDDKEDEDGRDDNLHFISFDPNESNGDVDSASIRALSTFHGVAKRPRPIKMQIGTQSKSIAKNEIPTRAPNFSWSDAPSWLDLAVIGLVNFPNRDFKEGKTTVIVVGSR